MNKLKIRSERPKPLKKNGSIYLTLSILSLFSLMGVAGWLMISKPAVDKNTLCTTDGGHENNYIIIDSSTSLSPNQSRAILNKTIHILSSLSTGERITVFDLDDKVFNGLSKPLFDKCKPKSGENVNLLLENKNKISQEFNDLFYNEFQKTINGLLVTKSSKHSPIIESLIDISSFDENKPDSVFLFSDLIQHTKLLSFYKNPPTSDDFVKINKYIPDLKSINLNIFLILRSGNEGKIQNNDFTVWWDSFFYKSRVQNYDLSKIR